MAKPAILSSPKVEWLVKAFPAVREIYQLLHFNLPFLNFQKGSTHWLETSSLDKATYISILCYLKQLEKSTSKAKNIVKTIFFYYG